MSESESESIYKNISTYNNTSYNLLYIDTTGIISKVDQNTWIANNNITLSSSNLTNVGKLIKDNKITQLHTGEFLYLSNNCLCI